MLHPVGGGHALAGKAVRPGLPGPFIPGWTLAGLRFNAGHPGRPARLGLSFQHINAFAATRSITACCWVMTANKASRGAVVEVKAGDLLTMTAAAMT